MPFLFAYTFRPVLCPALRVSPSLSLLLLLDCNDPLLIVCSRFGSRGTFDADTNGVLRGEGEPQRSKQWLCPFLPGLEFCALAFLFLPCTFLFYRAIVERGMTFYVSVGFSHLKTSKGKSYAVWLADTVHLPKEEGAPPLGTCVLFLPS